MIIHSIVPIDYVMSLDQGDEQKAYRFIHINNIKAEVKIVGENTLELRRIFSTDIKDYLKPEYQPGTRIELNYNLEAQRNPGL